jgi:carbamoyltransferase
MTWILGISAYYHDSAAALLENNTLAAAAQEERFTRIKHDSSFPVHAVTYCLTEAGIDYTDLKAIVFYDKPFLKFERILDTYLHFSPYGLPSFLKAIPLWIKKKIWLKALIEEHFPGFNGDILFTRHHQAHAASAFYPSPFERSAIVTVDGVGEWTTTSIGLGEGNRTTILKEIRFPHSLGLLYSAFTYFCGFKVNSGEYKLMGLAPYGEPVYTDLIREKLIDIREDGSFHLNMSYFDYAAGLKMTGSKFNKLFGAAPRKVHEPLDQIHMDLARSVQEITDDIMLKISRYAGKLTGSENLCLAGGVALNCVANRYILESGLFKNIWIQPAAGDAGGAPGAALAAYYEYFDHKRTVIKPDAQKGSLLGPSYSDSEIGAFLDKYSVCCHKLPWNELVETAACHLKDQKVVGWFQGRMEFGPRALGNRSILADPRSPEMQKQLNLKIKYRESFRPFAPAVLDEFKTEYFNTSAESPYMLLISDVNMNKRLQSDETKKGLDKLHQIRSQIPAVTHVDYSARLQTVRKDVNPRFHELINAFYNLTACPVLVNTSFNVRGEPIVNTPEDAFRCFMNTEMDVLVIGSYMVLKSEQKSVNKEDWKIQYEMD